MILELACGNGIFSRRLRDCGACVIATDFSSQMIELAHRHGNNHDVEFSTLDCTSEKELNAFSEMRGVGSFDAVVINVPAPTPRKGEERGNDGRWR